MKVLSSCKKVPVAKHDRLASVLSTNKTESMAIMTGKSTTFQRKQTGKSEESSCCQQTISVLECGPLRAWRDMLHAEMEIREREAALPRDW